MKLKGKTTPIALRLSNDIVARIDMWAWQTGKSRGDILIAAFTDWLNAQGGGQEYHTRADARIEATHLRSLGFKAYVSGGKGHWRVLRLGVMEPTAPFSVADGGSVTSNPSVWVG